MSAMHEQRGQYLTFQLAGQDYGITIAQVREIRASERPTRLPHAPEYVEGVIHVRGSVLPILDLRRRFALGETDRPHLPVVVVVQLDPAREAASAGLVVDAVLDVCEIDAASIQTPPQVVAGLDADLICGLCSIGGRFLILLDAGRLIQRVAAPALDASMAAA
jgi:purine-binding chemotaxis protein CheW